METLFQTRATPTPAPGLLRGSLTQLPKQLHSQGGVDEEEQHKEEAQVAHLWGQQVGLGRAWGGWAWGAGRAYAHNHLCVVSAIPWMNAEREGRKA